jgi:dTDP-glucose 4,6-dehydratase
MKTILITGGAGFIGSHLIDEIIQNTDWNIIALCRISNIGDLRRITHLRNNSQVSTDRVKIVYHDLKFDIPPYLNEEIGNVDYIAHIAANSHVDRSIVHPKIFFEDNVMGTVNLLEWYRKHSPGAIFLNFLTDEVFGPAPYDYDFKEDDRWRPSNPYSASKCGQGAAGISYHVTYGLPVITTYCMNIFGPKQHPEKFVSKCINNLLSDQPIDIHAKLDHNNQVEYVGERHWIYVRNCTNAILFLLLHGRSGDHYNIVGQNKLTNDAMASKIAWLLKKTPKFNFVDFHQTRPGHDRRYGLDGSKLTSMGWSFPYDFDSSLEETIVWHGTNEF